MSSQVPFSSNVLSDKDGDAENEAPPNDQFPASFKAGDDLLAPTETPNFDQIEKELNPKCLHEIVHHLWLAGRPVPPHALHHQLVMGRDIVVSERIDIHLVWGGGNIFLKPIPRFLLNPLFWSTHLACHCAGAASPCKQSQPCRHRHLRQCALGFLLSYVALIAYESDFTIAQERKLIPAEVTWPRWRRVVRELLHSDSGAHLNPDQLYADVAKRFLYGELRINRLRLIDKVVHGPFACSFMSNWTSYGSFARDNSASIIAATAWILLLLSSMQVGLGTEYLAKSTIFQKVSWGFTLFSIFAPLGAVSGMLFIFVIIVWYNLERTKKFRAKRSRILGQDLRGKNPSAGSTVISTTMLGENSKDSILTA